jgi:hypothetical protein
MASHRDIIFRPSVAQFGMYVTVHLVSGRAFPSRMGGHVMRLSSSFAATSAVAILSTALLCGPRGTAVAQAATGSATVLPNITVEAPKQVARAHRMKQEANTVGSGTVAPGRTSPTAPTRSAAPDSILGRIAKLEKAASSCNGGCETSFKHGDAPWVGCSFSGGEISTTCRDTLTYKTYLDCMETTRFLGSRYGNRRLCSSLLAGGRFTEEKPAGWVQPFAKPIALSGARAALLRSHRDSRHRLPNSYWAR